MDPKRLDHRRQPDTRFKMAQTIWLAILCSAYYLLPQVSSSVTPKLMDPLGSSTSTSTTMASVDQELDSTFADTQLTTSASQDHGEPDSSFGAAMDSSTSSTNDESSSGLSTSSAFDRLLDPGLPLSSARDLTQDEQQVTESDSPSLYSTDLPSPPSSQNNQSVDLIRGGNGPRTLDGSREELSLAQMHVKNRKSREQKGNNFETNSRVNASTESRIVNRVDDSFTTTNDPPVQVHSGQAAPMLNALDYDDFDLDYQLKINSTNSGSSDLSGSTNKKPEENSKPPSWTKLIGQHVFSPTTEKSTLNSNTTAIVYNTSPPMMPALLTVKSTKLTSQELNKIRPQLMMYHDNLDSGSVAAGSSYSTDQSLNLAANGDLLATASAGALPLASELTETSGASYLLAAANSTTPGERQSDTSVISLINGSPAIRQQTQANVSLLSRPSLEQSSSVTTILIDSVQPSESPATLAPTTSTASSSFPATSTTSQPSLNNSTIGGRSTSARESPAQQPGSTSQANQWFNYPHPNLHHNPLLLHHILNNPTMYAQHVANQQNQPSSVLPLLPAPTAPAQASTSTTTAASTSAQPVVVTQASNIIEKPTLGSLGVSQPAPINQTQLHMQLNEMRAIAAGSTSAQSESQMNAMNKSSHVIPVHHHHHHHLLAKPGWQAFNSVRPQLASHAAWSMKKPDREQVEYLTHLLGLSRQFGSLPFAMLQQHDQKLQSNPLVQVQPIPLQSRPASIHRVPNQVGLMHHILGNSGSFGDHQSQFAGTNLAQMFPSAINHHAYPTQIRPMLRQITSRPGYLNQPQVLSGPTPMVAAPSHQQEVYAPRPQAPLHFVSPVSPESDTLATNPGPSASLPTPLMTLQTSRESTEPIAKVSHSSNLANQTGLSEEDMSTYVAQLASLNARQHITPQLGRQSDQNNLNLDAILQKLLTEMDTVALNEQPQLNTSSQAGLESVLEHARIVGIPEDVQAQIYRDHLQHILRSHSTPKPVINHQSISILNPSTLKVLSERDPHQTGRDVNSWQYHTDLAQASANEQSYSSIDGHQEQQRKFREQQSQREKQIAFIEALRATISRLHNTEMIGLRPPSDSANGQDEPDTTSKGNLSASASSSSTDLLLPDQFDEPQQPVQAIKSVHPVRMRPPESNSRPMLPDWLERQILQESLVHETGRINPVCERTKITYIGSPSRLHGSNPVIAPIPVPPRSILRLQHSASMPLPTRVALLHHHHYPASSLPRPMLKSPMITGNSPLLALAESNLQPSSMPIFSPTKILADRFPLTNAPAYLVKLPTLTGGTITAAGSLTPPFSYLWRNKQMARLLNQGPAPGVKLVSTMAIRPSASVAHPHYLPHPSPSAIFSAHPALHPPHPPVAYLHHPMGNPASQPSNLDLQLQHLMEQHRSLQALASSPNVSTLISPDSLAANIDLSKTSSPSAPQNPSASALNRLQQATASLVELTSLASLVEEMVGGSEPDSPALALANAINSLAVAQSGNLPSFANSTSNDTSTSTPPQLARQPPSFSWKNLLNPYVWRDGSPLIKIGFWLGSSRRHRQNQSLYEYKG